MCACMHFYYVLIFDLIEFQGKSEVELELRLLEALEIYPPSKLRGKFLLLILVFYHF